MFTHLRIQVTDTAFPKIMVVPVKHRIVLGRSDEDDPTHRPDVDFLSCNALRNGISRSHAMIETSNNNEIHLIDLDSRNGTFLNDEQLIPNQAVMIKDGDQVQLGRLKMTIHME